MKMEEFENFLGRHIQSPKPGSEVNTLDRVLKETENDTQKCLQIPLECESLHTHKLFCRYMILRKRPTLRKFLSAMVVLASLFICLIPKIFTSIDPDAGKSGGSSGPRAILWPLCFMLGFVSKLVQFIHSVDFKLLSLLMPGGLNWSSRSFFLRLFAIRQKIV